MLNKIQPIRNPKAVKLILTRKKKLTKSQTKTPNPPDLFVPEISYLASL